jgi:type IV pilus assembly protein PilO
VTAAQLVEPFLEAPRWQRMVLGVLGLVAVGAGGYFLAVSPMEMRVTALHAQHDAQQQELARLRALAVDLARIRREAAEVERKLDVAKNKLPTDREIPALYGMLSDAAVKSGLAVALFQPQGPRVRDFYSEIPIAFVAEGGYHEVGDFIGRVTSLPRATMVGELKLLAADGPLSRPGAANASPVAPVRTSTSTRDTGETRRPLRAEMTLVTYVYRPVGSPLPAASPAGAGKPEAAKP